MAILTGSNFGQSDIIHLESYFHIKLPDDYKEFLKKYNGFRVTSPDYCDLPFMKVDNGFISFDAIFGYQTINANYDLVKMNEEFLDELSFVDNAIIIGIDPSDNCYVMITQGDHAGIYYWDRTCLHAEDAVQDYSITDEDDSSHLYLVEKKFKEFFENIKALTIAQGMTISFGL